MNRVNASLSLLSEYKEFELPITKAASFLKKYPLFLHVFQCIVDRFQSHFPKRIILKTHET